MALRETVDLDIAQALQQITQLEGALGTLEQPVVIPVDVEGSQAVADLRQQVDAAGGTIDLDVDTSDLSRGEAALREVRGEIDETGDELAEAQTRARGLRTELERTGSQGATAFGNLRQAILPLVTTLAAGLGIREAVQQFRAAIDSSTALSESINAVNVVFEDGAPAIQQFGETAAQSVGLAASELNQLATPIGALLGNFNIQGEEAADVVLELTTRAADLASVFNTEVPDALAAIGSALRGEQEPIRAYGVALDEAQVAQKALALGLADTADELTTAEKGQARLQLILEQSAFAAGDFANTSDEAANKTKILAAEAENARAAFGDALLPAYEAILEATPALIQAFDDAGPAIAALAGDLIDLGVAATSVVGPLADAAGAASRAADLDIEDVFGELVDSVQGTDALGRAGENVARFLGLFELLPNVGTAASQFEVFRNVINEIVADAAAGVEPIDALNEAFSTLTAEGVELTASGLDILQESAGASNDQFRLFLQALLAQRDNLGLTADSILAISAALNEVNEEFLRNGLNSADVAVLNHVGVEVSNLNSAATELATSGADRALLNLATGVDAVTEASGALPPFIADLDELQAAADDAGLGILAFLDSVDEADNITIDLSSVETELLSLIETLGLASFDLSTKIGEAFGVGGTIDEETKKIPDDVNTFLETLQADIEAQTDFEIDLSQIEVVAPDLAQSLADQGIDVAADIAAAFAADPAAAARAQELLDGTAEQLATGTAEAYAEFLKDLTPKEVADLAVFGAENFISPAVQRQLADTANTLATDLLELIDEGISGQTIAPEIIIDLSQAQIDLATLPGLQGSPLSVPVPARPETQTGSTGGGLGGSFGGTDRLVVNVNNATTEDVTTSATQAGQIIQSVASSLARLD